MEPVDSGIHQKTEGEEMKPTDEAKRLRDEINGIIADMVCDNQSSELTEEIISKVLDAVEEQGKHHIEYILAHTSDDSMIRQIGIDAIDDYIDNINKLRP